MTVERVNITPTRMIVRSGSGNAVFDTQNKYIKTAAAGNLFVNKQVPTPLYYTLSQAVKTPIINGAHLRTVSKTEILSGAQVSFKYPEFSGKLALVPYIDDSQAGTQPMANLLYRIKVNVNGQNLVVGGVATEGICYRAMLFRDGGGIVVPVLRSTDELVPDDVFSPGDIITVGGIDQLNTSGVTVNVNVASTLGGYSVGFFAYQESGTILPLQVTV